MRRIRLGLPASENNPVRTLLRVQIESFAVIAAYAFSHQNVWALNRSPFAGLLTNLTVVAFGPTLDPKNGEV